MARTVFLKVTSAFLVNGKIAKVGDVVEVGESDAKSLLHRGKAVLAAVKAVDAEPLADVAVANDGDIPAEQTEAEAPAAETPKAKGRKAK